MSDQDATALALHTALDDGSDLHAHTAWAAAAARDVVSSLRGCSGFDGAFDALDDDLIEDIQVSIEAAIGSAYRQHERAVRGRRTELVAEILRVSGGRAREHRRHAGEMGDKLDATETELARLRDVLCVMSRRGFGLDQSATAEESAEYWYRQTERLRGMARGAFGVSS